MELSHWVFGRAALPMISKTMPLPPAQECDRKKGADTRLQIGSPSPGSNPSWLGQAVGGNNLSLNNPEESFRAAMAARGLSFAGPITPDGKLHRFKAEQDGHPNSWYVLHVDRPVAGSFGCWKRGWKEVWCHHNGSDLSDAEWKEAQERWRRADAERTRAEASAQAKARKIADRLLKKAGPPEGNTYLVGKGVKPPGEVRQRKSALLVPLRDAEGALHNLQFISPEGEKRFLRGGRCAGCFFTVASKPDGAVVICEGVATGASIHEATGLAVVAAMTAGNLKAVAEALRAKWPEREIILAGDNDAWTDGNPGTSKATEAAKAIGARLAVPEFCDATTRPSDFNDLAALEGPDVVRRQIGAAAPIRESDEEALARLAGLSGVDYDRCRQQEAQRLGIRVSALDAEVEKRRPHSDKGTGQGAEVVLASVEPWEDPVDGAALMVEVAATFERYVALPPGATDTLALWTAHTHAFDVFLHTPRLNLCSPEKGCGKKTLLDVLATLVSRPLRTENVTPAVLFRLVEAVKPTLLLDEVDCYVNDNDELRGLLNAGHKRGAKTFRCDGESNEVRAFSAFAPAALAGIGTLPGTLHDRSLVVPLVRARPGELAARFDSRRTEPEDVLCRKLARWVADNRDHLAAVDPILPPNAFNRLADNWRPLFAVAEVAGGDWPARAKDAFNRLVSTEDSDAQGLGTMLLSDIRLAFAEAGATRMFSKLLTNSLNAMCDRPWPEANRGKPISENWLARRLKVFKVVPKTLRNDGDRAKGYELGDFDEAFARFLPDEGIAGRDTVTSPDFIGVSRTSDGVTTTEPVTGLETQETSENINLSRCHASKTPALEENEQELASAMFL